MYFKDLQEVEKPFNLIMVKIGWLDFGQPYNKGVDPSEFVEKLKKIPFTLLSHGYHECPFCGNAKSSAQYLFRIGRTMKYYDVPEMIIHYIEEHNYLPPQEFIDVVTKHKLV